MKRIATALTRLVIIALLGCLCMEDASAQNSIPFRSPGSDSVKVVFIRKADNYKYEKKNDSTELIFLIGNVELQQEQTLIFCDSMVLDQKANIIQSFGNVHINDKDSVNIYSDYMKYQVDKKLILFQKKVKLTDGKGVLTTEELNYDMNTRIGTYNSGGKVVNNGSVLTSQEGVYYAETRDVYFKKNVVLRDPQYDLASDSLLYNTQTQLSTFITWTDIVFRDSTRRTVHTREGFYDLKNKKAQFGKRSRITDGPQRITAETMDLDDSTGISTAIGNAVYVDTVQGISIIAGRMISDKKKNSLLATMKPLAILKQDKDSIYVTADTLLSGRLIDMVIEVDDRPDSASELRIDDSLAVKKRMDSLAHIQTSDSLNQAAPTIGALEIPKVADSLKKETPPAPPQRKFRAGSFLAKAPVGRVAKDFMHTDPVNGPARMDTSLPAPVATVEAAKAIAAAAMARLDSLHKKILADSAVALARFTDTSRRIIDSLHRLNGSDSTLAMSGTDTLTGERGSDSLPARRGAPGRGLLQHQPGRPPTAMNAGDSSRLANEPPPKVHRHEIHPYASENPADSSKRYLQGYHHVRIFSDSLQAVCDSLWYSAKDSIFRLFTDPIVWGNGNYQVTGDTIFLYTKNKKADRLYVFENALAVNRVQGNLYNQLKGITLNGYFKDGAVDYMRAKGNAESIYYAKDDSNAFIGANKANADIIDMIWRNKQLFKVVLRNDASGTFYPIKKVNFDDMRLRSFKWLEARRPKTKYELFE